MGWMGFATTMMAIMMSGWTMSGTISKVFFEDKVYDNHLQAAESW